MDRPEFAIWFATHRRRFDCLEDSDLADFERAMAGRKVTRAEADDASFRMAEQGCRFRRDNLPMLLRLVHEARRQATHETRAEGPKCMLNVCQGTGFVVVPHPKSITNGNWDGRATQAVHCNCGLKSTPGYPTLAGYESLYPDWPLMVRQASRERAKAAGIDPDLLEAEQAFLADRLAAKEISLAQAKRRAAEPWQEAAQERERQRLGCRSGPVHDRPSARTLCGP